MISYNDWIHANLNGIKGIHRIKICPYDKRKNSAVTYEFTFLVYPELGGWGRAKIVAKNAVEARSYLMRSADFAKWCAETDGSLEKASTVAVSANLAALVQPAISGNLVDLVQ